MWANRFHTRFIAHIQAGNAVRAEDILVLEDWIMRAGSSRRASGEACCTRRRSVTARVHTLLAVDHLRAAVEFSTRAAKPRLVRAKELEASA